MTLKRAKTCFDRMMPRGYAAAVVILSAVLAWPSAGWSKTPRCDVEGVVKARLKNWADKLAISSPTDPSPIVGTYAPDLGPTSGASLLILLPTCQNGPLTTRAQITEYFKGFLANKPVVETGFEHPTSIGGDCTTNFASGLYTFLLNRGTDHETRLHARYTYIFRYGLIIEHHSSLAPEIKGNVCPLHH